MWNACRNDSIIWAVSGNANHESRPNFCIVTEIHKPDFAALRILHCSPLLHHTLQICRLPPMPTPLPKAVPKMGCRRDSKWPRRLRASEAQKAIQTNSRVVPPLCSYAFLTYAKVPTLCFYVTRTGNSNQLDSPNASQRAAIIQLHPKIVISFSHHERKSRFGA